MKLASSRGATRHRSFWAKPALARPKGGLTLLCVVLLLCSRSPSAEADWGVKRDPFDSSTISRSKSKLRQRPTDERSLRLLLRLYRQHRTLNLLVKEFRSELDKNSESRSLLIILARLQEARGAPEESEAYLHRALKDHPEDLSLWLYLARLQRERGRLDHARSSLEEASRVAPKSKRVEILWELVALSETLNDADGAEKHLNRIGALEPKNPKVFIRLGDAMQVAGRHRDALTSYEKAEDISVANPASRAQLWSSMALSYEALGDASAAITTYRRAISSLGSKHFLSRDYTLRIIELHRSQGTLRAYLSDSERALGKAKPSAFEWSVLAQVHLELGEISKAKTLFRKSLARNPRDVQVHRNLIHLLEHSGQTEELLTQYRSALRAAPGDVGLRLDLAKKYQELGEVGKAQSEARAVERNHKSAASVQMRLADLYSSWNRPKDALVCYQRVVRLEGGDTQNLIALGQHYEALGKTDSATATWKRILKKGDASSYATLGDVFANHDRLGSAVEMFDAAIALEPTESKWRSRRALVLERAREPRQAMSDWELVMNMLPDDPAHRAERDAARQRVVVLMDEAEPKRLQSRLREWQREFSTQPPSMAAGLWILEVAIHKRDGALAQKTLQVLTTLAPNDFKLAMKLARVYRRNQRLESALKVLEGLVRNDPGEQVRYWAEMAEISGLLHRDEDAVALSKRALAVNPKSVGAHLKLGDAYVRARDFDQALASFEEAYRLEPTRPGLSQKLARLYERGGHNAKAAGIHRDALRVEKDPAVLRGRTLEVIRLLDSEEERAEFAQELLSLAGLPENAGRFRLAILAYYAYAIPLELERASSDDQIAASTLIRLSSEALSPLVAILGEQSSRGEYERVHLLSAISLLGDLGNPEAVQPLLNFAATVEDGANKESPRARNQRRELRTQALVSAARIAAPQSEADFFKLRREGDDQARILALYALGKSGSRRSEEELLKALASKDPKERLIASLALGTLGSTRAQRSLTKVSKSKAESIQVRAAAVYGLALLEAPSAQETFVQLLGADDLVIRRLAAWALARMKSEDAEHALLDSLFQATGGERLEIFDALALGQSAKAQFSYGDIAGQIADDPEGWQENYESRFGWVAVNNAPPRKWTLAKAKRARIAGRAILKALQGRLPLIKETLADLDSHRAKLGLAASDIVDEALRTKIFEFRSHEEPEVRVRALSLISKTRGSRESAFDAVGSRFNDSDPQVRKGAWIAAARLNRGLSEPHPLMKKVWTFAESPEWQTRLDAVPALQTSASLKDRKRLATLARHDPIDIVRGRALRALAALTDIEDLHVFIAATTPAREGSPSVRLASVEALANYVGSPLAIQALREATRDPSARVRRAASALLGAK